ncbi:hypothetical protein G7Z17_g10932 [Cylindrodendrum hubeiense]|uniref:Uncharacterized protein n=1 Tax=Cylindrodendrum hubeiense TaxID=595255 RepID=A0A9P5L4D5_9HYPO|nr:hypothetical protein G7Z17_g10932 [Cylindrodendrum hubeiense]
MPPTSLSTLRTVPTVHNPNRSLSSRHVSRPHAQTPVDTLAALLWAPVDPLGPSPESQIPTVSQPLHSLKAVQGSPRQSKGGEGARVPVTAAQSRRIATLQEQRHDPVAPCTTL